MKPPDSVPAQLTLRDGDLAATVSPTGELRFYRADAELPWRVDLGAASAWVSVRQSGVETRHPVRLEALDARHLTPSRLQWLGEIGGAGVALEIELAGGALRCSISPLHAGSDTVSSACWPGDVSGEGAARESVWGGGWCFSQGSVFRSDGAPWETTTRWGDYNTIRLAGLTVDCASLAIIVETPYDATSELADDGVRRAAHRVVQNASLGELRYARTLRLAPLAETGYVAMANLFRDYAQRNGMWVSWAERVAENPALAALPGAFFGFAGYLHDDEADIVGAMRRMKQYGFARGYVYSPKMCVLDDAGWGKHLGRFNSMSDAQIRDIQSLGYICSPFMELELASQGVGEHLLARDADGKLIDRWTVGEMKYYEIVKWRVPGMIRRLDRELTEVKGIHFDTLAAMPLVEHSGAGSYDRAGDVRERIELARYYRRQGKIITAEGLKDWANPVCDISTSRDFTPWLGPRPGLPGSETIRVWNLPLADLVYHDSCIRSGWEHFYYNDTTAMGSYDTETWHPFAMPLMDLLTASPPVLFPEGKMYRYQLEDTTDKDGRVTRKSCSDRPCLYRNRFDDPALQAALPEALRVCRLNRRHGTARMLSHRFLEPGSALVQESVFATGLRVVANFGDEPYTTRDGKTVGARSALTEE